MSIDPIINETPINIILDTNIPGEKSFSFTKNILHNKLLNKSDYSEYPYFSSWIPYPRDVLVKMDYTQQVGFFFKKDDFLNILKNTSTYQNLLKQKNEINLMNIKNNRKFQSNPTENNPFFLLDKNEQNNNIRNNIMIMLTLLFPISFPTKDNIMNTYDALFLNESNISSVSSIIPSLLNMLGIKSNKEKYSYIQSPSKGICTVTQITWLNDIYNHPEYKKIILQYQSFQLWKSNEKINLNIKLDNDLVLYKNGKYEKIWNDLLSNMESIDENEIPTSVNSYYRYSRQYSNNPRNDFNRMKTLLNKREEIINNKKYEDLFKIKKYYNNLNNINITRSLFYDVKNIRALFSNIEEIQVNYNIINKYLDNDSISLDNEDNNRNMKEDERIIDQKIKQWDGYKKYSEFVNLLKIFNRATNQSTNDLLQNVIDNFILKNSEDKTFELMLIPSNSRLDNIIKLVETGITMKKSNPIKNTIYLRMDAIVGEIDDSNKNSINCVYNKDYLGSELETLLKSKDKFWELNNNRFLFDLNSMKTIENKENDKEETQLKVKEKPTENINLKYKGGNKKRFTRKNRK